MRKPGGSGGEEGFTLVEIMASIVILSVVSLTLSGFFIQAMSYSKHNQSKTIAVQLGRNALSYLQKQPFQPLKDYLSKAEDGASLRILSGEACSSPSGKEACQGLAKNPAVLQQVLHPAINGVLYTVSVRYQDSLAPGLQLIPDELDEVRKGNGTQSRIDRYLLPVIVTVAPASGSPGDSVEVEGYLTDETIR
ncbi:prepilin-type N-terminal cleavage/methylation domain-containing protein [Paenibacillus sp. P22]|uniref:type IV pilus modification PilV family protein n=1 Tax=Paenibacillus sp. P22 TaxID=483908 RepID=UPI0004286A35|nr:prepilin-type N-terminal cleavage/methylation domain-containing protein [Paenibacillus sp. P22]CDN43421.1 Putative uncharacterized protein [Paenibacillus sp. P22]